MKRSLETLKEDLRHDCKKAENIIEEINNDNDRHIIIKRMAQQINNRINDIQEICSVDKYNLYFNGKVAIGKSTTVCNLFG